MKRISILTGLFLISGVLFFACNSIQTHNKENKDEITPIDAAFSNDQEQKAEYLKKYMEITPKEIVQYYIKNFSNPALTEYLNDDDEYGMTTNQIWFASKSFFKLHDYSTNKDLPTTPIYSYLLHGVHEDNDRSAISYTGVQRLEYLDGDAKRTMIIDGTIVVKEKGVSVYFMFYKPVKTGQITFRVLIPTGNEWQVYPYDMNSEHPKVPEMLPSFRQMEKEGNRTPTPPLERFLEYDLHGNLVRGVVLDEQGKIDKLIYRKDSPFLGKEEFKMLNNDY